jgi:uncharacterized coiled-coil DUF342 family protein
MADNIKLLEELVVEAADRLRELTRERDELRKKVDALSTRLDALKRKASKGGPGSGDARGLEARRARAVTVIREALTELRDDGTAA